MAGEEIASKYQTLIFLAGSASAEFFADIALSPFEAVKVREGRAWATAAVYTSVVLYILDVITVLHYMSKLMIVLQGAARCMMLCLSSVHGAFHEGVKTVRNRRYSPSLAMCSVASGHVISHVCWPQQHEQQLVLCSATRHSKSHSLLFHCRGCCWVAFLWLCRWQCRLALALPRAWQTVCQSWSSRKASARE